MGRVCLLATSRPPVAATTPPGWFSAFFHGGEATPALRPQDKGVFFFGAKGVSKACGVYPAKPAGPDFIRVCFYTQMIDNDDPLSALTRDALGATVNKIEHCFFVNHCCY